MRIKNERCEEALEGRRSKKRRKMMVRKDGKVINNFPWHREYISNNDLQLTIVNS